MIARLEALHAAMTEFVLRDLPEAGPQSRTSTFWQRIFDRRPDLPDLNGMLTFRRSPHLFGTGNLPEPDVEKEERLHRNSAKMVYPAVSPDFVAGLKEPQFGAPLVFRHGGPPSSENFLMNARKTHIIRETVRRHMNPAGHRGGGLHVCDIGGGWGAVGYQLHQCMDVASFTDIDLPGNLFFAGIFLPCELPGREPVRMAPGHPEAGDEPRSGTLRFVLPQTLDELAGHYDLILNSLSLQEMDRDSARAYVDWAYDHLSPGGLFISINRHGLAGVEKAYDYGFCRFTLKELYPVPSYNFFMGAAYVAVMSADGAPPRYDERAMNGLCELMQLGLDRDLDGLCPAFCRGGLTDAETAFLREAHAVFTAPDPADKARLLDAMKGEPVLGCIALYMRGLLDMVLHRHGEALTRLREALDAGLGGCARAKAAVLCCALLRETGGEESTLFENLLAEAARCAPYWEEQVRDDLRGHIGNYKADLARKLFMELPPTPDPADTAGHAGHAGHAGYAGYAAIPGQSGSNSGGASGQAGEDTAAAGRNPAEPEISGSPEASLQPVRPLRPENCGMAAEPDSGADGAQPAPPGAAGGA